MNKQNNTIFVLIGIIILVVVILSQAEGLSNSGLFSLFAIGDVETCVSNEPDSLEGYELKLKDITFGGKISEFMYLYGGYVIEPNWNECTYEPECVIGQTEPCKPRCPAALSVSWDLNALSIRTPLDPEYHGATNCEQFISIIKSDVGSDVINVFDTILLKKGIEIHKIIYETSTTTKLYVWCNNNDALFTNNELIVDLYFNTFYTCEEEPEEKCYAYTAEICQEIPCSTAEGVYASGIFDTLEGCQEATLVTEEECLFTINEFCFKLWMLLSVIGAILLIYISTKK